MRRAVSLALAGLLAVMIAAPVQAATISTTTVNVPTTASGNYPSDSSTPKVDSGVYLAGYSITVTAVSVNASNGAGYPSINGSSTTCYNATYPCTAPDLPAYALIAQIGDTGAWQFVGAGPTTLTGTGEVFFAYNDGRYDDNTGSIAVTISYDLPAVTTSCSGITPGTYSGFSFVSSTFVPSDTAAGATGPAFTYGAQYLVESQGVYQYGSNPTWLADAEYSFGYGGPNWVKSLSGFPSDDLNLLINGNGVDWGAFSSAHTYTYNLIGTGSPANFGLSILDSNGTTGYYSDNSGGLCASVFKDDVAPLVSNVSLSSMLVPLGTAVTLTATADDSTTGDSYIASAEYSLNRGAWTPMSASDGSFDSATEGVTAPLNITTPGVYNVCVQATDAAGNTGTTPTCASEPLVVYDASAGFVTGGGRDSNNNNFGFVAKYQSGGSVPVGSLEYQYAGGNFHSNSFTYLVVNGDTATLAGTGTLDGVSGYSFVLNVTDNPDQFQITISGPSSYSSGSLAPISKGSIQIHS